VSRKGEGISPGLELWPGKHRGPGGPWRVWVLHTNLGTFLSGKRGGRQQFGIWKRGSFPAFPPRGPGQGKPPRNSRCVPGNLNPFGFGNGPTQIFSGGRTGLGSFNQNPYNFPGPGPEPGGPPGGLSGPFSTAFSKPNIGGFKGKARKQFFPGVQTLGPQGKPVPRVSRNGKRPGV